MNAQEWVNRLAMVPDRIARAVAGQSEAALRQVAASGGWSAADILAHVRASDDIMAYRYYGMLVRDNPPLPAYDEHRWADVAGYVAADFPSSLHVFAMRRAELVSVLRRLAPDDWQRAGVHETRGTVSMLHELIYQVEHEEEHCGEMETLFRASDR
ncbi:MAG: DinB family protein [Anaerolineae bacterium]